MTIRRTPLIVSTLYSAVLIGCAGRFKVTNIAPPQPTALTGQPTSTKELKNGLRIYTPHPYLLVTNMQFVLESHSAGGAGQNASPSNGGQTAKKNNAGAPPGGQPLEDSDIAKVTAPTVTAAVIYLPDYDDVSTISVSGGLIGTFKGAITLDNGWMLTSMNEEGDAKVAETLTAIGGIVGSVLGKAPVTGTKLVETLETPSLDLFLYLFKIDTKNHALTPVGIEDRQAEQLKEAFKSFHQKTH